MTSANFPRPPHPVAFDVEYPERLSRGLIFIKWLLIIPHFVVVYALMTAASVLAIIAWFAILFTGRYPAGFREFTVGTQRWASNVFAYYGLMRDEYPPFSWEPYEYAVALDVPPAERQSRWRLLIRWFALIPNQFVFAFVQLAWFFTTFIAWWAILFTGRYPRGLFRFNVGVMRWYNRQWSYSVLLRDEYPPYSGKPEARPGNEVVSTIIGAPIGVPLAAFTVAIYVLLIWGSYGGGQHTTVDAALLNDPVAMRRDPPTVRSASLRITLLEYEPNAVPPPGTDLPRSTSLGQLVAFHVRAEKDGFLPAFYTPHLFMLNICGRRTDGEAANDATSDHSDDFELWLRDGSSESIVYFWIDRTSVPCELTYFTGTGIIEFRFRPSGGGRQTTVDAALLGDPAAMRREEPSARGGGLAITLLEYDAFAVPPPVMTPRRPTGVNRLVSFSVRMEQQESSAHSDRLFRLTLCGGEAVAPATGSTVEAGDLGRLAFESVVFFWVPTAGDVPCELTYFNGSGSIEFRFHPQ